MVIPLALATLNVNVVSIEMNNYGVAALKEDGSVPPAATTHATTHYTPTTQDTPHHT